MSQERKQVSSLDVWQAERLRLTAFPPPGDAFTPADWWQRVAGTQPDSTTSQPKKATRHDEGLVEDRKLILDVQPNRIDWFFRIPDSKELTDEPPLLGSLPELLDVFSKLMTHWLQTSPPVRRLAFGAVLFRPVEEKAKAYAELSAYLPYVKLDSKGSDDIFYQINRPRDSSSVISGLKVNRLSRWSYATWRIARISLDDASARPLPVSEVGGCQLELDISTAAEYVEGLPHQKLPELFVELVSLGKEIAIVGDIA